MWKLEALFFTLLISLFVYGERILLVPIQMHSHVSDFVAIGKELVKHGHEVYTVSYDGYLEVNQETGINTLKLPCNNPQYCSPESMKKAQDLIAEMMFKHKGDIRKFMGSIMGLFLTARESIIEDGDAFFEELQKLHFDLVFVDGLFTFRWYYLIPHRLGVPYVTLSDVLDPMIARVPWLPSFVPHVMMSTPDNMTFLQRVQNSIYYIAFHFAEFMPPLSPNVVKQYQQYGYFRNLEELESRSLIFFQTTDNLLDYPKPLMPNIVNMGGVALQKAKSLSGEHLEFADKSVQGLVVVSFGSGIAQFPTDIAGKMISVFGRLTENVVWRFDNKHNLTIPSNVKLANWLPQNDYLSHKNVRLFVTHGGKHGIYESMYHSKPMLGMPIQQEQRSNVEGLKHHGYGLGLDLFDFTEEELYNSMREVLDNPVYSEKIRKASDIFKSRKESPAQRTAYWIDHILKFGGGHLRSYALDMPLYQYMMLDILFTVLLILTVVFLTIMGLLCMCYNILCGKPNKKSSKKVKTG